MIIVVFFLIFRSGSKTLGTSVVNLPDTDDVTRF